MMRKFCNKAIILLVAAVLGGSILAGCNAQEQGEPLPEEPVQAVTAGENTEEGTAGGTAAAETAAGTAEEYAPNREYDKYALVDYTIEDIMAQFTATVSAKEDGSEYELHCMVEGAEQLLVLDGDLNIVSDQTGDIANDAPAIVQKAIDEDKWTVIEK